MQKISQRVLMQECIESMEKVAAPTGVNPSLLQQILGNVSRTFKNKSGINITPSAALKEMLSGTNSKAGDDFINKTLGTLKKKLNAQEIAKVKSKASQNDDLLAETGKALMSGKNLGGSAGAGAAICAAAGALHDTDEESTNMLGVTQKKKGKFSDRLKNMATGAAIGAAGGAGLKAKSIAKKSIDEGVKSKLKNIDVTKGLSNDDILQKAFSSLAAGEYSGEVMQHLDKAYNNYLKSLGKANGKPLQDALDKAVFKNSPYNIRGLEPNKSGILERFVDRLMGREAKRNAVAEDYTRALNILLQKDRTGASNQQLRAFMAQHSSPREALMSLYKGNRGKDFNGNPILNDATLANITRVLNFLTDSSQASPIAKAFQNRATGLPIPFSETPRHYNNILHKPWDWAGYNNPEALDKILNDFVANSATF